MRDNRLSGRSTGWATGLAAATLLVMLVGTPSQATEKAGRFSMSPAEGGGFARLDTETGAMALCQRRDTEWTCRNMAEPGRGLGEEVERLRSENQRLKAEIRQMEDIMLGDKRAERRSGPGEPGTAFKLPTEQDVDQAMSYVQRMMRKFREKLKELETESGTGKGTPL